MITDPLYYQIFAKNSQAHPLFMYFPHSHLPALQAIDIPTIQTSPFATLECCSWLFLVAVETNRIFHRSCLFQDGRLRRNCYPVNTREGELIELNGLPCNFTRDFRFPPGRSIWSISHLPFASVLRTLWSSRKPTMAQRVVYICSQPLCIAGELSSVFEFHLQLNTLPQSAMHVASNITKTSSVLTVNTFMAKSMINTIPTG